VKTRTTLPHEEVPAGEMDWLRKVLKFGLCRPNTLLTTYGITRRVVEDKIPGDLVECGVFAGAQAAVMAHVCCGFEDTRRNVHLFDSFLGIPHAGARDTDNIDNTLFNHGRDGVLKTTGIAACSMRQVITNMAAWQVNPNMLVYHAGWFQDTISQSVPALEKTGIAVLRLDGDLYESTLVCLRNLLPLLSPGGYIIIDDWALTGCREAVVEVMGDVDVTRIPEGDGPVYWQKV